LKRKRAFRKFSYRGIDLDEYVQRAEDFSPLLGTHPVGDVVTDNVR